MCPLPALAAYFAVVFIGGALLAPWLYQLVQWLAAAFPGLQALANNPFHRYLNRSLMVLGLLGLWPFLRSIGLRSWKDVGLESLAGNWRKVAFGFLLGFGSLACVAGCAVLGGARQLNLDHSGLELWRHLRNATLAAAFVALLEELFFRGVLLGALRKTCHRATAVILSSAVYALLHFFQRPEAPEAIEWSSGLMVLAGMLRGFGELEHLVPGFFTLTLAGIILAVAYLRTGTLFFSIGLHAGWIFWLKSYGFITQEHTGAKVWFWGSGKLTDGWLALIILLLVCFAVARFPLNNKVGGLSQKQKA
ncbi:MAG: type II CAAX endopeptidase family protein [Verrucomicrobiota bacterium]